MKPILVIAVVAVVLLAGGATMYVVWGSGDPPPSFRTATVSRGELLSLITASGSVEPEEVVDVGAQVAGRLLSLGRDTSDPKKSIDYCSVVQEGTVLAILDDSLYRATLDQAVANLTRAKADLLQYQAKLLQATQDWKRAQELLAPRAIAATDYDLAEANYKAAQANVEVGKAVITQCEAALRLAKTNLDYTTIKSPIKGTIIARRVNVGQTVVASLNAPSLFLIAKDLKRMEVWAQVNEADIGRIRPGMPVRFTVDAFPDDRFAGTVEQIRLNAQQNQNVVIYTVVVGTDNSSGKLIPYLTANLKFEVEKRTGALQVPNAAIRWKPRVEQVVPDARDAYAASLAAKDQKQKGSQSDSAGKSARGDRQGKKRSRDGAAKDSDAAKVTNVAEQEPERRGNKTRSADNLGQRVSPDAMKAKPREEHGRVWIQDGNFVRPVDVVIGASDGTNTEISGSDVKEDMEVVVSEKPADAGGSDATNPFAPKMFRSRGMR